MADDQLVPPLFTIVFELHTGRARLSYIDIYQMSCLIQRI